MKVGAGVEEQKERGRENEDFWLSNIILERKAESYRDREFELCWAMDMYEKVVLLANDSNFSRFRRFR